MLAQDQIERFYEDGFLLGSRVLDDRQVDQLLRELHRVIEDKDDLSKPQPVQIRNLSRESHLPVWQIVNIWQASIAYRQLIHQSVIVEEVAQLTGAAELRIWHDQIQYKPAEVGGVNMWHQDAPYWPILTPDVQVTAWVALDDVVPDNGCMSMVVGSHKWGDQAEFIHTFEGFDGLPTQFKDQPITSRLCPVSKGHVHYHHSLTWHASHHNTSSQPRRAIALHYMPDSTRYNAAGDHAMKMFVTLTDGKKMQGDAFPRVWPK